MPGHHLSHGFVLAFPPSRLLFCLEWKAAVSLWPHSSDFASKLYFPPQGMYAVWEKESIYFFWSWCQRKCKKSVFWLEAEELSEGQHYVFGVNILKNSTTFITVCLYNSPWTLDPRKLAESLCIAFAVDWAKKNQQKSWGGALERKWGHVKRVYNPIRVNTYLLFLAVLLLFHFSSVPFPHPPAY